MKQKFRFAELYRRNCTAVEKTLSAMWTGEAKNESQQAYVAQLKQIIPEVFAPKDAMPLVQCMNSYKEILHEHKAEAEEMLGMLWKKTLPPNEYYAPYEHQYQCWKTLLKEKSPDGKNMSIVVTTGTGSGKTECFMLPLVQDLLDNYKPELVQAIFLYPLNALMEDQKARMEKLLAGTDLRYAVYNGDMPERLPSPDNPNYKKILRKIDAIKGITRDKKGNIIEEKFPQVIATREDLRAHPANILLTNPTMLEYILLRDKDKSLIQEDKKSLRWIALDETHTYTGAGAAEMAMLIRRVLMAFGVTTDEVRFATSSATIGGNNSEAKEELKQFIAKVTGLKLNQVEYVDGERKGIDAIPDDEYKAYWLKLINNNQDGYIRLDELIDKGETIEEKLIVLDEMCGKAEEMELKDLRVKVHYFYRVPNHGLYVDISDPHYKKDGSFKIYTENRTDAGVGDKAPLLELSRCKHCGEYVAIAEEVKYEGGEIGFSPIIMDDSDMFDLDITDKSDKTYYVFATTRNEKPGHDNNAPYIIKGNKMQNVTSSNPPGEGWRVIANTQCCCPYCGTKLTKPIKADDDNPDAIQLDDQNAKKLQKFRIAADFISRILAPSTLDLMTEGKPKDATKFAPHNGQQYISFVDSRQLAARTTIKQNLEEERLWIYGTIFHELCKRKVEGLTVDSAIALQTKKIHNTTDTTEMMKYMQIIKNLQSSDKEVVNKQLSELSEESFLSWRDILEVLLNDKYADTYCEQFAERSEISPELDEDGNIRPETKRKYILSLMVEYLSKRPLTAAAPETMGLFTSYYIDLKEVLGADLPAKVQEFNIRLNEENRISKKDWYSLMQIFLDYTVRSNQSVFLKMSDTDPMDIFQCVRFATKKERRRPVHEPIIKEKSPNRARVIRLIAKLIANDKHIDTGNAITSYRKEIQDVIDCMWSELIRLGLLEHGTHYDDDVNVRQHVKDRDEIIDGEHFTPYRLNLAKLGFKLYDEIYLCDTNTSIGTNHVEWLRPVEVTFHNYSPYIIGGEPVSLDSEKYEKWAPFPYYNQSSNPNPSDEVIEHWAKENRKKLWEYGLWGENGTFSDRLLQTHQFPDLFIQAEHTAQVDKMISRQTQDEFRDHRINILACSTTMEMGVDLGDLELVMMTSVPPHPSNYKQRAGRSGRRGQVRSACVTLCGSDAVGVRTMVNPMESVIQKSVNSPTVDLNSAQVIQRHVNSFLVREFGVFGMAGGSVTEQVLNYYTNYEIVTDGSSNHFKIKRKVDHSVVTPLDGLGDEEGTPYETFNNKCSEALSDELIGKLKVLLTDTIFSNNTPQSIVSRAREANEDCYSELELRIQDYAEPYKNAKSAKQQAFFELKFIEPLATRLLSYWATHRFTPNANMPVNVIEFDINSSSQRTYTMATVSNPSYPLRTALAQYAPGNPIARDGIVRIVRGIRYTNFFKPEVTFKKLYFNQEQVVIDNKFELDEFETWDVTGTTELDLLQPAEFIPDMNESANRILDQNVYTRVSAQLIGAKKWEQDRTEPHLFDARSSRESGNGQILYYNEGTGFGYCHCTKCGKTVLESWPAARASDPDKLPPDMNDIPSKDTDKENIHFSLIKKDRKPSRCIGCNSPEFIKRNVVLGDTIPTDYTEIRIRHLNQDWINKRLGHIELLNTLGIVFTQSLTDLLNVERNDLDFTITPNGHICVFDTNPGGSGYANKLAEMDTLKTVIGKGKELLEMAKKANSKDAIIDRYTLHLINSIDIESAIAWIEEELAAQKVLPAAIEKIYENAQAVVEETSLVKLERVFAKTQIESVLFVDDNYSLWNYNGTEHGWRNNFLNRFASHGNHTIFCVCKGTNSKMPEPILEMIRSIKGWTKDVVEINNPHIDDGLFPIAYVDGKLYFTNNPEHTTLNDRWGNGTMFCVKTENPTKTAKNIDCSYNAETTQLFFLSDDSCEIIHSKDLGKTIHTHDKTAQNIIDRFINHCKSSDGNLYISYQDEHMKSLASFVLTLQTIEYFVNLIGKDFRLEFFMEEYYYDIQKRGIFANIQDSDKRDDKLVETINHWWDRLKHKADVEDIESKPAGSLTHWRVLNFEYNGKRLSIYPDGGLLNGWKLGKLGPNERYEYYDTTTDDNLPLQRQSDIKFEVHIEDINYFK